MKILGIETSCDETSIAIVKKGEGKNHLELISNLTATSLLLHAKTGGIIPEIAAREQLRDILPILDKTLQQTYPKEIDAIAVTVGPGLIGSLLVGVETARTLSLVWNKPLIPVNHLMGHIYANWILTPNNKQLTTNSLEVSSQQSAVAFPALALVVSGGHTDLVLLKNHKDITLLGGTRDDAAGEAFDKIGRLLGFPYPAGPIISELATKGDSKAFNFPRPLINSDDFDFSFSGLKTAVLREVQAIKQFNNITISNICASVEQAIVDVLVKKTLQAALKYNVKSILLGGGVAANEKLRNELIRNTKYQIPDTAIFIPQKSLCTDNAAMIAAAAFYSSEPIPWQKITANPELYFD